MIVSRPADAAVSDVRLVAVLCALLRQLLDAKRADVDDENVDDADTTRNETSSESAAP